LGAKKPISMDDDSRARIRATVRTAVALACHLTNAVLILLSIKALELILHWLWAERDPTLFGVLPLGWVFHGMDVAVLLVFAIYGTISVARAFKE
jgi:hypothetical protein